ncbi:MAG: hypothetical protein C0483_07915 [Pirellula sp.]|nr:hypothetical protein [Pirellula sp.]
MFNNEGECGTGAVVPWADRLWVITYGPHLPFGSSDKLYEITSDFQQTVRPESVGGTPANRMIHRESEQLIIGPYLIDARGGVRVIPSPLMPGRLTGNARHLTDPAHKVYYATMEEGLYEVDLKSLAVTGLIRDGNKPKPRQTDEAHPAKIDSELPGYHGKGLYSGQGRVAYANNGERSAAALVDPTTPSGALAEWRGSGDWQLVRRNQFTEITGPGGIYGNEHPKTDPLWSLGWDARSLLLMLLDDGEWHVYRLPKASHTYDGAHGWNTEWPRIRDIGETDLLATMHGTFWRFPRTFSQANSAGIAPRSTYLKVVGDFCRWGDRVVLGCDDTAKSEFLNKRKLKGEIAGPGQSQSNLAFLEPAQLDQFGPALGRGAVWLNDDVKAGVPSDPFLFAGYERRALHLAHAGTEAATFTLEVDRRGDGRWEALRAVDVAGGGNAWIEFPPADVGAWLRIKTDRDCSQATAMFHFSNADLRGTEPAKIYAGLAQPSDKQIVGGLLRARGENLRTLLLAAEDSSGDVGPYELDADLKLRRIDDSAAMSFMQKNVAIPRDVISIDEASVLFVDEQGKRWRLPKGDPAFDRSGALGVERVCREVCTERDLLNVHGTFYELPAENAGGIAKVRPIATHNHRIHDYASYRGLLVLSGVTNLDGADNPRIIRSDDNRAAVWVGSVDELWQFGKPRGVGGPWKNKAVQAGKPSDPYLMTGYDRKRLTLAHDAAGPIDFRLEADFTGIGSWSAVATLTVKPGEKFEHHFSEMFAAYWVRLVPAGDCTATAKFVYE